MSPDAVPDRELLVSLEGGVLRLTINRPEAGNAIPYYVRDALTEQFERAHADLAVRCVVLSAAGDRHFCTGADLRVRPPAPERPDGAPEQVAGTATEMMRRGFQRLMSAMQDCEKPVLVACNGTAAGGGAMLLHAADLVVAAEHARVIHVFVRRGLIPDGGVAYLLPQLVGMHRAKELLFFGDDLSAGEAAALGIVNRVVPAPELAAAVDEWAERLARGPTKAIGWTKRLLHDAFALDRPHHLLAEAHLVELNTRTEDSQEGVRAFMERRDTDFKGY